MTRSECLDALRALVRDVDRWPDDRPLWEDEGEAVTFANRVVSLIDDTFGRSAADRDNARQVAMFEEGQAEQLRKFGVGPRCAQCHEPFNHGCNSAYCSEACEDAAAPAERLQPCEHRALTTPDGDCAACARLEAMACDDCERSHGPGKPCHCDS